MLSALRVGAASVDLVLIVAVCWALLNGHRAAVRWGLLGGLALDFLSVAPFGTYTLALAISVTLATFTTGLGIEGPPMQAGVTAASTLCFHTLMLIILQLSGIAVAWDLRTAQEVLSSAALNGLVAPFIYWAAHGINRRVYSSAKQEIGW